MEEVYTKIVKNTYVLIGMVPVSKENADRLNNFEENRILKNKITGAQKLRSVKQNAWVHAILRFVSNNTDHPEWNTEQKAKDRVKLGIGFIDQVGVIDGVTFFKPRSFAFDKMKQHEANRVYSEAKEFCALFLGVDPKVLQAKAEKVTRLKDDRRP